jgi:hypothetical protein
MLENKLKQYDVIYNEHGNLPNKKARVKLLPCAHCDGIDIDVSSCTHTPCFSVKCACGAEFTGQHYSFDTGNSEHQHFVRALKNAVDGWNRRAK